MEILSFTTVLKSFPAHPTRVSGESLRVKLVLGRYPGWLLG